MSASSEAKGEGLTAEAEWAQGRATIDKCDERIHDLRKQGLLYLTGLVTAQSVLGIGLKPTPDSQEPRCGVAYTLLLFSLIVIVTIRFFEKYNQLLQAAAASRCLVLERRQSAELTETIHDRWCRQRWPLVSFLIYAALGGLVYVLYQYSQGVGGACPPPKGLLTPEATGALTLFLMALGLVSWLDLRPTSVPGLDWSIDATVVQGGGSFRVRVVNLSHQSRVVSAAPRLERMRDPVTPTTQGPVSAPAPFDKQPTDRPRPLRFELVVHMLWRRVEAVSLGARGMLQPIPKIEASMGESLGIPDDTNADAGTCHGWPRHWWIKLGQTPLPLLPPGQSYAWDLEPKDGPGLYVVVITGITGRKLIHQKVLSVLKTPDKLPPPDLTVQLRQ